MNERDERFASLVDFIKEKAKALGYTVLDGIGAKNSTIYLSGSFDVPVIDIYYRGINFYLNGLVSCQSDILNKEIYRFALTRGSGATDSKWYCQYYIYPDVKNYNYTSLSFLRYLEWHEPNRLYKVKLNRGILPVNVSFKNCIFNDNLWHSNIPTHIDVNESRFEKNADKIEYFIEDALKNMLKSYNVMRKDEKINDIQACASEYEV
jgi:hypothetical protein